MDSDDDFEVVGSYTPSVKSNAGIDNITPKRKTGKKYSWKLNSSFDSFDLAKEKIKHDDHFIHDTAQEQSSGKKIYYKCKRSRDCPSKIYLYLHGESQQVDWYSNGEEHDHGEERAHGLSVRMKELIWRIYENGVRGALAIQQQVEKENPNSPIPTRKQISNFLTYKKSKREDNIINLSDISRICEKYSSAPEDEDLPYIVHYEVTYSKVTNSGTFQFVMTTKRLMKYMRMSSCVHADSTYKLIWEGFPVQVVGTSDKDRQFHPCLVAVTTGETEADFKEVFTALKLGAGHGYLPIVLIADAADAISNAFAAVFGPDFLRVHCWFHAEKNAHDHSRTIGVEGQRKDILNDIRLLQLAESEDEFREAGDLWVKKWKRGDTKDFAEYFSDEHIDKRSNWYEGYAVGFPSTNNGLESCNGRIKRKNTMRNKLPLTDFVSCMQHMLNEWSCDRNPTQKKDYKAFIQKPSITLPLITKGYNWATDSKRPKGLSKLKDGKKYIYLPASGTKELSKDDLKKYMMQMKEKNWETFEDYRECKTRLWVVEFHQLDWKMSQCNCPKFKKEYMCKHVIGLAITTEKLSVPDEATCVPIGTKRPRGRPQKVKKALLRE